MLLEGIDRAFRDLLAWAFLVVVLIVAVVGGFCLVYSFGWEDGKRAGIREGRTMRQGANHAGR